VAYGKALARKGKTMKRLAKVGRVAGALLTVGVLSGTGSPRKLLAQGPEQVRAARAIRAGTLVGRKYREGEKISYQLKASTQGHHGTTRIEAKADGVVKRDESGRFVEEFGWSDLVVDGGGVKLTPGNSSFRQRLSLERDYPLAMPNLGQLEPLLIGPVADLLTFYADLSLAIVQADLEKAGDHVYLKRGTANSWAYGEFVPLGEDSIDFDITLAAVDRPRQVATVVIKHVPPERPEVRLPAEWMKRPVGEAANNWVQISKTSDGRYTAAVGQERFVVVIKVSLASGRILSATMENPVEVLERTCADAALAGCGAETRYAILRRVSIR